MKEIMNDENGTDEYMLLFRGRDWDEGLSAGELKEAIGRANEWFEGLAQTGKVKAGQPLARVGRLITGSSVVDGPFAESKEVVGGYLLLQNVGSLEEAIEIAQGYPMLKYRIEVEVRPVLAECPVFARAKARVSAGSNDKNQRQMTKFQMTN